VQFIAYLYMPDRSIPMNIKLTGIQTLISFQLSFSTETTRQRPNATTTRELMRFCLKLNEKKKKKKELVFIIHLMLGPLIGDLTHPTKKSKWITNK
jgi:hypothetical protein